MTTREEALRLADALMEAVVLDKHMMQAAALLRQWPGAAPPAAQPGWMPIESAPKGRKVLAGYTNSAGKWRTVTACYYLPQTLELDGDGLDLDDDGYAPEGWYEESESQGNILPTDMPPSHWMPLPPPPGEQPAAPPAGMVLVPVEPTQEMIEAYLDANTKYWREVDELPRTPLTKWRQGTPSDATRESYRAMIAAALSQPAAPAVERKPLAAVNRYCAAGMCLPADKHEVGCTAHGITQGEQR